MPTVQIKNVSPETHAVLTQRAAAAHQSLQASALETLDAAARRVAMALGDDGPRGRWIAIAWREKTWLRQS